MPNEPSQRPASGRFARDEWELLVTLPGRVLVAASAAASSDPGEPTAVTGGLAGLAAIAAGHDSASPLVREVVAAIYAESLHPDAHLSDPPAGRSQTLAAGERAAQLLAAHAEPADADAYRDWLSEIAGAVCGVPASRRDGRVGLADNSSSKLARGTSDSLSKLARETAHSFLDDLRAALVH
jgi:hypothetical protein